MPSPTRRPRLGANFGPLEDRTVPAQYGITWPDADHLTVSFAPDGTLTPAGPSQAGVALANTPAWRKEVLRAFQTWAVNINQNVGLVADNGQALGTSGAVQGDSRFGDVRIAAAPGSGSDGDLAFSSPFTWSGTTYAGDVILDSSQPLTVGDSATGHDVFTVAVHEAGHALGLDHSTEAGSVMNPNYSYKTGLSAGDVARIQALYGARKADAFDAAGSNDVATAASPLPKVTGVDGQFQAVGDITTAGDVDHYSLNVPANTAALTVRLKVSGESLLLGRVTVYGPNGQPVATAAAGDVFNNDLTLTVPAPAAGGYVVRVEGASGDVFGQGGYRLVADLLNQNRPVVAPLPTVQVPLDLGTNDSIATATPVSPKTSGDARFDAALQGMIETPLDNDFYKLHSPATPGALNVLVWSQDPVLQVLPVVHVYDAQGAPVAFQVLANESGLMSVRVASATPNADYYVQVAARVPGSIGRYFLAADFNQTTAQTAVGLATGVQSVSTAPTTGGIQVTETGVYQFSLSAVSSTGSTLLGLGGVTFELVNAYGVTVLSLSADANRPAVTRTQLVDAGSYTVRYSYRLDGLLSAKPLRYNLGLLKLSDPIGPKKSSVSSGGGSTSSNDGYTYTGTSDTQPTGSSTAY